MEHEEIELEKGIMADIKIPDEIPYFSDDNVGIVIAHGGLINRKAVSRETYSFAENIGEKLNAYVITPDLHNSEKRETGDYDLRDMERILLKANKRLSWDYGVRRNFAIGYSMGNFPLASSIGALRFEALSMYGVPDIEYPAFNVLKAVFEPLSKTQFKTPTKWFKHIFDKETREYYSNVMLNDSKYDAKNYPPVYTIKFGKQMFDRNIFWDISRYRVPVNIISGEKDNLNKRFKKYYRNGYEYKNIKFTHIKDASHVTLCMEDKEELDKVSEPIADFFREHI